MDFVFESIAAKFYSEQGTMKKHSPAYVTEEQRSTEENLTQVDRRMKSQHAQRSMNTGLPINHQLAGGINSPTFAARIRK